MFSEVFQLSKDKSDSQDFNCFEIDISIMNGDNTFLPPCCDLFVEE